MAASPSSESLQRPVAATVLLAACSPAAHRPRPCARARSDAELSRPSNKDLKDIVAKLKTIKQRIDGEDKVGAQHVRRMPRASHAPTCVSVRPLAAA